MRLYGRLGAMVGALLLSIGVQAEAMKYDYQLQQRLQKLGDDTYWVQGDTTHFTLKNGGNVLNTGFIVTEIGVVVIDTGPSKAYGLQLRALIESVTDQPIAKVILTHDHPDHSFGNQAFSDVPIWSAAGTHKALAQRGLGYSDAMYRLIGRAMFGTEVVAPNKTLTEHQEILGGHELHYLLLQGHTEVDVAVFDATSGVLFAGDLVFYQRAPTTPHAKIDAWLQSLDRLNTLPAKTLIPGHGPSTKPALAIEQTRGYLQWLDRHLSEAASRGLSMAEALFLPLPQRFSELDSLADEYQRSVSHLYPHKEQAVLLPSPDLTRD